MPSLEQFGAPILILGALVTVAGFAWLVGTAFRTHFAWGASLVAATLVALAGATWLLKTFQTSVLIGVGAVVLAPFLAFMQLHRKDAWKPTACLLLGLGITASPVAINWVVEVFVPKGPRERLVDGAIHLTLTGVEHVDYSYLKTKSTVNVLQMANPDVTDDTLEFLADMTSLEELDLNDSQVSDAGLARLAKLPSLKTLRLRGTKITDAGFREHLFDLDRLLELDLTNTPVASRTVREWKKLKEGRKALK